jgi:hypothetical protein
MTNRTIQFYGQGFGTTAVGISVTANGSQTFNGPVPTLDQPMPSIPRWPLDQSEILFSIEVPVEFQGTVPMEITVNSGSGILFQNVLANYVPIPNPVYTPEQFAIITSPGSGQEGLDIIISLANPPFTQEEIDILANPDTSEAEYRALLATHNVSIYVSGGDQEFNDSFWPGDSRTNVTINGNSGSADRLPGELGDWTWPVTVDSTMVFTLNINAGLL